jgi:hypothetical protein
MQLGDIAQGGAEEGREPPAGLRRQAQGPLNFGR